MRGYIDCANDSDGPVFGPKTLAAIKAEMEALEKMYEEKYGLEFKDKSSDPQWPRVVANVNSKLYPDATLEIGRAPWHSDDHCDGYHIAITLQAEKSVRAYQKMCVEAQSRENVQDVDANGF